jgi:hypothetical protein
MERAQNESLPSSTLPLAAPAPAAPAPVVPTPASLQPIPEDFHYWTEGEEAVIEFRTARSGQWFRFQGIWLAGWMVVCAFVTYGYATGKLLNNDKPIPLWFVLVFVIPLLLVGGSYFLKLFLKKTFRLQGERLRIEADLFRFVWSAEFPLDSITELRQIQDGSDDSDSVPSWGLTLTSTVPIDSWLKRFMLFGDFGRDASPRAILSSRPYDSSKWLAYVLSRWTGLKPHLLPEPDSK